MTKRSFANSFSASLMALGLIASAPSLALESSPETGRAEEARQRGLEPVTDQSGLQLYTVYLDEALVEREDASGEAKARAPSDARNEHDWRGWHRAKARVAVKRFEREYRLEAVSMTSYIMPTFSAYLSPESARELGTDERVTKVEPVYQGGSEFAATWANQISGGEFIPWGKIAIGTNDANTTSNAVYMLDGDEQPHADLVSMQIAPVNLEYTDYPEHANHVAGILSAKMSNSYAVRGVNPSSKVISVHRGNISSKIQAALDWIMADSESRGVFGVVNISTSGSDWTSSGVLGPWVKRLSARVLVVQAAGNNGNIACDFAWNKTEVNDGILVVAAIDEDGKHATTFDNSATGGSASESGSNYGGCVEVWAPGQRILSTWHGADMKVLSGTSMAAPHVAALASRFGSDASTTPVRREYYIRNQLQATGEVDPTPNVHYPVKIPVYGIFNGFVPNLLSPVAASASSTFPGSELDYTYDRLYANGKVWNAGKAASASVPAWIEFDLGTTKTLKAIRLTPEQSSPGYTTHKIYAGNSPGAGTLLGTITSETTSGHPIIYNINATGGYRYVRVETTASVGWVAWREIEVYGFY